MIGKQIVVYQYKTEDQQAVDLEIQMTILLQIPDDDPYGDVGIEMNFEPIFPEELEDEFYQRLRNGVHGGIALSNVPILPPDNLVVSILELKLSPSLQSMDAQKYKNNLGYLLEVTVSGIVETLLRSSENLRTGKEIYYEG